MENNPARLSSFPTVFGPCICTLTYLLGRRAARPVKARGAADVGARARGATGHARGTAGAEERRSLAAGADGRMTQGRGLADLSFDFFVISALDCFDCLIKLARTG
jgi:hypothetical protein